MDELCSASSVIDAMAAEGRDVFELRAELFESALRLLAGQSIPRREAVRLLGRSLDEASLRRGLEESSPLPGPFRSRIGAASRLDRSRQSDPAHHVDLRNPPMICPSCGVEQMAEARFCEDCGSALSGHRAARSGDSNGQPSNHAATDASTCSLCGSGPGAIGADGFCTHCGHERVDVSRNHVEISISPQLAGVSDVGMKHFRNEDAMTLASEPEGETLVVCDGVSHSQNPDLAAAAAANAALEVVRGAIAGQSWNHTHDLVTAALHAARIAVRSVPFAQSSDADPPESTIVLAVRPRPACEPGVGRR